MKGFLLFFILGFVVILSVYFIYLLFSFLINGIIFFKYYVNYHNLLIDEKNYDSLEDKNKNN